MPDNIDIEKYLISIDVSNKLKNMQFKDSMCYQLDLQFSNIKNFILEAFSIANSIKTIILNISHLDIHTNSDNISEIWIESPVKDSQLVLYLNLGFIDSIEHKQDCNSIVEVLADYLSHRGYFALIDISKKESRISVGRNKKDYIALQRRFIFSFVGIVLYFTYIALVFILMFAVKSIFINLQSNYHLPALIISVLPFIFVPLIVIYSSSKILSLAKQYHTEIPNIITNQTMNTLSISDVDKWLHS